MPLIDILIPEEMGPVEECVIVAWFKREGDHVNHGDDLLIIQAEKVSFDVPSPATGTLSAILVQQGEVAKLDQPLARIDINQADFEMMSATVAPQPERAANLLPPPAREIRASPIAKRLARQRGIDLALVSGSGKGGRITEKDVRAFIETQLAQPKSVAATPTDKNLSIPMVGMRATIAQRMHQSLQDMAQITLHTEADATELVALRNRLKHSQPVTYTDLFVKASALALRQHPQLNATLDGDIIKILPEINIGLAVALEDGLIVPVLRGADQLSPADLARVRVRLVKRARSNQLIPADLTGGTFTITNLGIYDIDAFTPIVNPPEAAILGIGRIVDKVVIYKDKIAQRSMITLSLSFDHRLVDGAPAAAFLQTIKQNLEQPAGLE
ncbi:MAG: 2-oxo acid dehydrogenase subunit E2 [Anaerolineaceae bacterium]|nr:MAG: 2-oxo acid dehydrogenase subunit E2 [Anaerolineaceae bacterium]